MSEVDPLVRDTYERFADSEFGQFQSNQTLRYAKKYGYGERHHMLGDLGDDIHPVRHMLHTHNNVLIPLLDGKLPHELSPFDTTVIRTASLLHDIGECEHPLVEETTGCSVGDVLFHEKNSDHEKSEAEIRSWFYSQLYPEVSEELISSAEEVISNNAKNELSASFNLVERLGYYETALRAGSIALGSEIYNGNAERVYQLARLGVGVSSNHAPILDKSASDYEYIERRLEETAPTYDRIRSELISIV